MTSITRLVLHWIWVIPFITSDVLLFGDNFCVKAKMNGIQTHATTIQCLPSYQIKSTTDQKLHSLSLCYAAQAKKGRHISITWKDKGATFSFVRWLFSFTKFEQHCRQNVSFVSISGDRSPSTFQHFWSIVVNLSQCMLPIWPECLNWMLNNCTLLIYAVASSSSPSISSSPLRLSFISLHFISSCLCYIFLLFHSALLLSFLSTALFTRSFLFYFSVSPFSPPLLVSSSPSLHHFVHSHPIDWTVISFVPDIYS